MWYINVYTHTRTHARTKIHIVCVYVYTQIPAMCVCDLEIVVCIRKKEELFTRSHPPENRCGGGG